MHNHIVELNLKHGSPIAWRSCFELIITFFVYGIAFTGLIKSANVYTHLFFIILLALTVLRIFMIQHDCGHYSFFKSRAVNNFIGHFCSIFTYTPYNYWRKTHTYHHGYFGISGKSDLGYIKTLSVEEFESKNRFEQWRYTLIRSPFALLFIIAPLFFIIVYRLPFLLKMIVKKISLANVTDSDYTQLYILDGVVLVIIGTLFTFFGTTFFINYLISLYIAAAMGMLLFYVQHNIDHQYSVPETKWSQLDQGLKGSSYFKLPNILRWFSGNIGYHHIHHLCLKIPFYKLPKVQKRFAGHYKNVTRIHIKDIPHLLSLKLYDKKQEKMITWREYQLKKGSHLNKR